MDPESDFTPEDLIREPRSLELLNARIRDLEEANKELKETVEKLGKDPLTGADNRFLFEEKTNQALSDLRRISPDADIAFIFADANNFKKINDEFGHPLGDRAIKLIAEVLRETFARENDVIGRRGGDEFYGFLPGTSLPGALYLINKLHQTMAEKLASQPDLKDSGLTLSVGIVMGKPKNKLEVLENQADQAMFKAKSAHHLEENNGNGRNQIRDKFGKTAVFENGQIQLALG